MEPLLVILGPTAIGKTRVAIDVATQLEGEIISADSMQVYRHFNIGTAKPSQAEMQGIPHHLIDFIEPTEKFNVARFQREVMRLVPSIVERGHLPMLVGGTGLYISAVVDNYDFSPDGPNPSLRKQLLDKASKLGSEALHNQLSQLDPVAAKRIQPTDTRRIIRALEVAISGGQISASGHGPPLYRTLQIGLTRKRKRLYKAINQRVDDMFARGLCQEAQQLLARGLSQDLPAFQALGYKELLPYLQGKASLDEVKEKLKRQTRRFAKRQLTWFRRDSRIIWFDLDQYHSVKALATEIAQLAEGKLLLNRE